MAFHVPKVFTHMYQVSDVLFLLMRQLSGDLYYRANEKKEQEAKHRGASAADSQIKSSAAVASSDSQAQLHQLKSRNDELEDEVSLLCCLIFDHHYLVVWRTRVKIIRTVQCCVEYHNCTQF